MMDPGDEDSHVTTGRIWWPVCPFCGDEIRSGRNVRHIPLPPKPDLPLDFTEYLNVDWNEVYCEDLTICNSLDCRRRAHTFQKLQAMTPEHKQKVVGLQRSQRYLQPDSFWNKPAR